METLADLLDNFAFYGALGEATVYDDLAAVLERLETLVGRARLEPPPRDRARRGSTACRNRTPRSARRPPGSGSGASSRRKAGGALLIDLPYRPRLRPGQGIDLARTAADTVERGDAGYVLLTATKP